MRHYIDLSNVEDISRGDHGRRMRYLNQFVDLVGHRSAEVSEALSQNDRVRIRMVVHSMKPQLLFFGVKNVQVDIDVLELKAESLPSDELRLHVVSLLDKCEKAKMEVTQMLKE